MHRYRQKFPAFKKLQNEKYIVDEYNRLMEIVEEYEDIKEFDERMKDPEWISLDEIKNLLM